LQRLYGGSTTSYAGKTAGKISDAKNALDIAFKTMSSQLLPVIAKIATEGAALIMYLIKHKGILITLGVTIGSVTAILTLHKVAVELLRARAYAVTFAQDLLRVATGKATFAQTWLGKSAGTAGGEVSTMGAESKLAGGKLSGFGGGLLGLAGKMALAAGAFELINAAIPAVKSRVNEIAHPYAKHGFINEGLHPMVNGQGSVGGPGVGMPLYNNPHRFFGKINSGLNAVLGIGGHGGGLLHAFGLNKGGVVPRHFASGGPVGQDTVPAWMTPGEGVINTRGMGMLGQGGLGMINSGQGVGQHITIQPGVTIVKLETRAIARAVTEYMLQKGARGPSSLVGGSLSTGAAVTGVTPG
jgi:hypothetical protein